MLNKPTHEVELVYYGTTGSKKCEERPTSMLPEIAAHIQKPVTCCNKCIAMMIRPSPLVLFLSNFADTDNPLNNELGEDQYMNITVEQELNFPDTTFLASVLSLAQVIFMPGHTLYLQQNVISSNVCIAQLNVSCGRFKSPKPTGTNCTLHQVPPVHPFST